MLQDGIASKRVSLVHHHHGIISSGADCQYRAPLTVFCARAPGAPGLDALEPHIAEIRALHADAGCPFTIGGSIPFSAPFVRSSSTMPPSEICLRYKNRFPSGLQWHAVHLFSWLCSSRVEPLLPNLDWLSSDICFAFHISPFGGCLMLCGLLLIGTVYREPISHAISSFYFLVMGAGYALL